VINFIRQHPDRYDAGMLDQFAKLVERLDPPAATGPPTIARAR
jgi:hypothetical protein